MGLIATNLSGRNLTFGSPYDIGYVATAALSNGSTTTIALAPAGGTAGGDLLIYSVVQQAFASPGTYWTPPAGWTEVHDGATPVSSVGWKIAAVSQGSSTWTSITAGNNAIRLATFRNAIIDVVGAIGTQVNNTATITIPGVTTTVPNTLLLAIIMTSEFAQGTDSLTGPAGWEPISVIPGIPSAVLLTKMQGTAGATGNITANFNDFNGGHWGLMLALAEPAQYSWLFSTQTVGYINPPSTYIRYDQTTITSVSQIGINNQDELGVSRYNEITNWARAVNSGATGYLTVGATNWTVTSIDYVTFNYRFNVTYLSGSTTLPTNNQKVSVRFTMRAP